MSRATGRVYAAAKNLHPDALNGCGSRLKIRSEGQTAGVGPCFQLPGQPILEFWCFEPQPNEEGCKIDQFGVHHTVVRFGDLDVWLRFPFSGD